MREFTATDWFTITGRGQIAAVTIEDGEPVKVGEHVRIDGDEYEIQGIERSRILIDPPILSPHVGLVVRRIVPGLHKVGPDPWDYEDGRSMTGTITDFNEDHRETGVLDMTLKQFPDAPQWTGGEQPRVKYSVGNMVDGEYVPVAFTEGTPGEPVTFKIPGGEQPR